MSRTSRPKLPVGIWRHNKSGGLYQVIGIGTLATSDDDLPACNRIGYARYSEDAEALPALIYLNATSLRPGGQWVIDSPAPLPLALTFEPFVIYAKLDGIAGRGLWFRPLSGEAGWTTKVETSGLPIDRFSYVGNAVT